MGFMCAAQEQAPSQQLEKHSENRNQDSWWQQEQNCGEWQEKEEKATGTNEQRKRTRNPAVKSKQMQPLSFPCIHNTPNPVLSECVFL